MDDKPSYEELQKKVEQLEAQNKALKRGLYFAKKMIHRQK